MFVKIDTLIVLILFLSVSLLLRQSLQLSSLFFSFSNFVLSTYSFAFEAQNSHIVSVSGFSFLIVAIKLPLSAEKVRIALQYA